MDYLRAVKRFVIRVSKRLIMSLAFVYLRAFKDETLSRSLTDLETNLRRAPDQTVRLKMLLDAPIRYLDVGARGGISGFLAHYRDFFKSYLVEPDPVEAERLKQRGYSVIDKALSDRPGMTKLNIARKGGLSSLLEPNGAFLPYYKGDSDRFDVIKSIELHATTIESVTRENSGGFDLLKLDTQGSELAILKGMGTTRPLFIVTEISFGELYGGQATVFDIAQHLMPLGYIVWDLSFYLHPVPGGATKYTRYRPMASGLPLHGDACFMPNWASPEGLALIKANDLKWAALMLIFGMEDILGYVMSCSELPNASKIRAAMENRPSRLPLDSFEPVRF